MINKVGTGTIENMLAAVASGSPKWCSVGYAQSPQALTWVRREGARLLIPTGELALDWVFDLRLFGPDADLHWWWEGDHGRWAILDDQTAASRGWRVLEQHRHQRTRLIRGTSQSAGADGWTVVWDGNSAPFSIPIELTKGQRAAIDTFEYTARDAHGTVDVVAERFTVLKSWKEPTTS